MQQASRRRGFQDCPTGTSRTSQERCKGKKLHFSVGSAASAVKSPSPTLTGIPSQRQPQNPAPLTTCKN